MKLLKHKKVLKKEFLRALEEGDRIIEEAEDVARRIVEEAHTEAARIRARAAEEGFEEGKAQAAEIICEARAQSMKRVESLEKEIIDLVVAAASSIIGKVREIDLEVARSCFRKALEAVQEAGKITLRVSPADYGVALSLLESREGQRDFTVVKDESLTPGGCLLESEVGIVNGRIETQLGAVRRALLRAVGLPEDE